MKRDTGQRVHGIRSPWYLIVFAVLFQLFHQEASADDIDNIDIFNENEIRSRILMINGHIYIHAGINKNITFRTGKKGSIYFGETDIQQLPNLVQFREAVDQIGKHSQDIQLIQTFTRAATDNLHSTKEAQEKMKAKITKIEEQIKTQFRNNKRILPNQQPRRYRMMATGIRRRLDAIEHALSEDNCINAPCKNGGTCISLYKKYICLCLNGFEGQQCDLEVNLCELYANTELGCQNGGKCITRGIGFTCQCAPGYHGHLCQTKSTSCDENPDLCGPKGHCSSSSNKAGYKCICEWGYRSINDTNNPTCEDIDECEITKPCYPGSTCINLPGSFKCATCPPGMTGNGISCTDIDECSDPNLNDCSKDPPVQCVNTIGSYQCEPCPAGYVGDGRTCMSKSFCDASPCDPLATCYEASVTTLRPLGYVCICPRGFTGTGIGTDGCRISNKTICRPETCLHGGRCLVLEKGSYHCICPDGYAGKQCERSDICTRSSQCNQHGFCQNGRCNCFSNYYGKHCELSIVKPCTYILEESSGNITSTKNPENTCEWYIHTYNPDSVIELTIGEYNVLFTKPPKEPCDVNNANLIIRDGPRNGFPMAVFCNSDKQKPSPNTVIHSSSGEVTILHKKELDPEADEVTFSFSWKVVPRGCGGRLLNGRGEISLLNYNEEHVCQWHIYAQPRKVLTVQVESLKLMSGNLHNCTINSLEFYDGLVVNHKSLLRQLCNSETNRITVTSSVPYLTVYFKSNFLGTFPDNATCRTISQCSRGLLLWYDEVDQDTNCGATIKSDQQGIFKGWITSPEFGTAYPPILNCIWLLDASPSTEASNDGFAIKIEIESLDLPSSPALDSARTSFCPSDSLAFYDGEDITKPLIGQFCNDHPPIAPLLSSGPKLTIRFSTDAAGSGAGFKLNYHSTCEKHYDQMVGTISTWNYPDGSKKPFKCTYVIDAFKTKAIRIKFLGIKLNKDFQECFAIMRGEESSEDYVEISGGHSSHDLINKRYYCEAYPFYETGEIVTSATRPLKIIYSASSKNNKGLLLEYEQFDVGCGGVFQGDNGVITSPNYPESYLSHMHCIYVITAPPGKVIRIHFDSFELEVGSSNGNCVHDSVRVYDSYVNENETGKLHGSFCGTMLPPPLVSTENTMAVVFISDRSIGGGGFSAKWDAVDAQSDCHRTFTESSANFTIIVNGSLKYTSCDYFIALPSSHQIRLKIWNFTSPCEVGTLMIRNGANEDSPGFTGLYGQSEICDDYPVTELRSHGNRIFMRFTTKNPTLSVFHVYYEEMDSGCGGRLNGLKGSLSAPQYPLKDARSLSCTWLISVAAGNRIQFIVEKLDELKSAYVSGFCMTNGVNHLDILDGFSTSSRVLKRYCEKEQIFTPLHSENNELLIKYRQSTTTYSGGLFGFLAHFDTDCKDVVLSKHYGVLQSPGYPGRVFDTRQCHWRIQTSRGNMIRLTFHLFRIWQGSTGPVSCFENFLEFDNEQLGLVIPTAINRPANNKTQQRYCNEIAVPVEITSKHNVIDIYFVSSNQRENHFWLSWNTLGCGGIILHEQDIYASLKELNRDSDIIECTWSISAPVGQRVKFFIEDFLIFSNVKNCSDDAGESFEGLAFYAGTGDSKLMQEKYCSYSKENSKGVFTSDSNEYYVLLRVARKYIKSNETFFKASISFIPPVNNLDCGTIVNVTTSKPYLIHSPNFPMAPPKSTICNWIVNAPDGHFLRFNITSYKALNYHPNKPGFAVSLSCEYYFLEKLQFNEGNNSEGSLIERLCKSLDAPKTIDTTTNQVFLSFYADSRDRLYASGDDERKHQIGFAISASLRCGGKFYADATVRSLQLDSFTEDSCEYVIETREVSEHVSLRIDLMHFVLRKDSATILIIDGKEKGAQLLGRFSVNCQFSRVGHADSQCFSREFYSSGNVITVKIKGARTESLRHLYFSYSSQLQICGGPLRGIEGALIYPKRASNLDCEWDITNTPGNKVVFRIQRLNLPDSEYCGLSFLEVRDASIRERFLDRKCGSIRNTGSDNRTWTLTSLIIRLRYIMSDDSEETTGDIMLKAHFKKVFGGLLMHDEGKIHSPSQEDWEMISFKPIEWGLLADSEHWIRVKIESIEIPAEEIPNIDIADRGTVTGLTFNEGFCLSSQRELNCGPILFIFTGYNPPEDFVIRSQKATVLFRAPRGSSFTLSWEQIPSSSFSATTPSVFSAFPAENSELTDFNCGGTLVPSFDVQYIVSPGSLAPDEKFTTVSSKYSSRADRVYGRPGGYLENLHCRWSIPRPLFSSVFVRIISIDMEIHPECKYDYLAYSATLYDSPSDLSNIPSVERNCQPGHLGKNHTFENDDFVYVYFFTDQTQNGRGFVLEYRLACGSYEYIPLSAGLLDKILYSPKYPANYEANLTCEWIVLLDSNRPILAEFIEMDIEDDPNCEKDSITLEDGLRQISNKSPKLCGKLIGWNNTVAHGRIFITFKTDAEGVNKGFALHLKEIVTDCSSDKLVLDEDDGPKILASPNFPRLSPHSLNCQWLISAPSGHRIKFTVDPRTFRTMNFAANKKNGCEENFLEIHDGPSIESPLIGMFCEENPPGTVYSSGPYLFVMFITNSASRSLGFNATYEIASCGGTLVISQDSDGTLRSPDFPAPYPTPLSCDWNIMVPSGHFVNASFDYLSLIYPHNCPYNNVSLWEGYQFEKNASILDPVCAPDEVRGKHFTSSRNLMHVKFRSNVTSDGVFHIFDRTGFQMKLKSSKIACGGEITDESGRIESPGYPGPPIANFACDWTFSAGFGFSYLLQIHTSADSDLYANKLFNHSNCYPDLYIYNGQRKYAVGRNARRFCQNMTRVISSIDYLTVTYDDRLSQIYRRWQAEDELPDTRNYSPFYILYNKYPRPSSQSCMYHIVSNVSNLPIGATNFEFEDAADFNDVCHIVIEKPPSYGTVMLRISNFTSKSHYDSSYYKSCFNFDSIVIISAPGYEPWPYEKKLCNAIINNSSEFTKILTHSRVDIYVYQEEASKITFNLSVHFFDCGGNILGPEDGIIVSPGYNALNGSYSSNIDCLWTLKAPEGQVIKVNISEMRMPFHYQCEQGYLALYEGSGTNATEIHRYCNKENVQERFRESIGRVLSLHFHFGNLSVGKGFKVYYAFHGSNNVCGFTTKRLNGTVTSPRYPEDYPNNAYCVWDISVPSGFHIEFAFIRFAIQKSDECKADSLKIMQEHQSRGVSPLSDYYFYYDRSAMMEVLCGQDHIDTIRTESNRIRLEFQTDDSITDKGFVAHWKAACGTVFRLSHGIITSPHYPEFYPDEDSECVYKIDPAYDGIPIILLKVLDFDLSPLKTSYNRPVCQSDFLEIRDINAQKTVVTFCADDEISHSFEAISLKGPVAIRFVVNSTVLHENDAKKLHRGFKISYALSKCGGAINLKDADGKRSREVTSPGFPLRYHHELRCVWNISASESNVISIKFINLQLEDSLYCIHDYVELLELSSNNSTRSMGRFCGSRVPPKLLVTSGPNLSIQLITDESVSHGGFKLVATSQIGPAGGCGGDLVAISSGIGNSGSELKPPIDPKTGMYFDNMRCGWTIRTDVGKVIRLEIEKLDLQRYDEKAGVCRDFLKIYDGYGTSSPLLMNNTCEIAEVPFIIKSSYKVVYVYFETNSEISHEGFLMRYKAELATCGGRKEAAANPITLVYESERGLTRDSAEERRCRWHLYATEKMPLRLTFSEFSFPSFESGCADSYLEIRDVGTIADCQHPACANEQDLPRFFKHCGKSLPADFVSRTSIVEITTVTYIQSEYEAKFALTYQTLDSCNRTINVVKKPCGRVTSPNYPNRYEHNCKCVTQLIAPKDHRILLVFKDFGLERGSRNFYGEFYPSVSRSRNYLYGHSYRGLSAGPYCRFDFVQISDTSGNATVKYCHSALPPTFFSSGNSLQLMLKTDFNENERGYDAYYYSTKPKSLSSQGAPIQLYDFGTMHELQGAITSIGFPLRYALNQQMKWRISPPRGHKCQLSLLVMDFGKEVNGSCSIGDRILLSETSESQTATNSFYLPCRELVPFPHQIPIQIGASVLLHFISDNSTSDNGSGFRMEYNCENTVIY